jgi:regulator of sirC expression with transglutaminase-like and TPR domain
MAYLRNDPAHYFAAELNSANPVRLALAIARIAYPDLDVEANIERLEEMAAQVAPRVAETSPGGERALTLVQAMRLELGLRGNIERYYDASNSYLNIVLERRTGLPIMLSLILVTIGQRLGLTVDGVGFPGHFMARYEDAEGVWFLDAFHGAVMKSDDLPAYFMRLFGQGNLNLDRGVYWPVAPTAWALRILNNLHGVYANLGNMEMLAKVLALMVILEPERKALWRELALVEYRRGEISQAARALRRYFYLQGYLHLSPPHSTLAATPPALDPSEQELWRLLEEIESAQTRWN